KAGGDPILGQKRSFCVEDTEAATATTPKRYCCNPPCEQPGIQGIQVGWGDLYASVLPCQWIDVTDGVEPGEYDLCVLLNTERLLPDVDPSNDNGCVPVTVDAPEPALVPKVKVRAPRAKPKRHEGRPLRITWQRRVKGTMRFQEIWFSPDDGATWTFVAGGDEEVPNSEKSYRWTIPAGSATAKARVRVVVWSENVG